MDSRNESNQNSVGYANTGFFTGRISPGGDFIYYDT